MTKNQRKKFADLVLKLAGIDRPALPKPNSCVDCKKCSDSPRVASWMDNKYWEIYCPCDFGQIMGGRTIGEAVKLWNKLNGSKAR